MIPILFESGTTTFTTNGLGRLADCVRCTVTEERNGIYECEFDYPVTGALYDELTIGRIIVCTHDEKGDAQPFIIYRRSIPDLRGIVTYNAHHISYMLNNIVVMPFTAGSCSAAIQGIKTNSANSNPFEFWTDKSTVGNYKSEVPRQARAMLGGEENSILDVFGTGEYLFDRFDVRLYTNRGVDSGVEIRYGKNLADFKQDIDNSGTFNAIAPYWADSDGHVVTLPEKIISYAESGQRVDAAPMDLSDAFEEMPTYDQLRSAARSKYERGDYALPSENIKVDFVQLWQTEEYKELSALQRVGLCDTVTVVYPIAGVEKVKQKVIRTVYNVLLNRYDEIELGTLSPSLGQAIKEGILQEVPTTSMMESAIRYATDMIRGGLGGYVVMTPGDNGYPQEILIMDTPDVNTAVNVWRFNQGGLGHSSTGYEGPFSDIALTADGKINASLITTGILNASLIRAGIIQDATGANYWNLESGRFVTNSIKLGDFSITDGQLFAEDPEFAYRFLLNVFRLTFFYGSSSNPRRKFVDLSGSGGLSIGGKDYEGNQELLFSLSVDSDATYLSLYESKSQTSIAHFAISGTTPTYFWQTAGFHSDVIIWGDFRTYGAKNRSVETPNYSDRLLYCYETPTPLFGDIGEATIDEDGFAYVDIDDIFSETVAERVEYQVFLQKEGQGDCWITEKNPRYFVIQGTPNLKVAWELKAKQRDYENIRLEQSDIGLEEYANDGDPLDYVENSYIEEQEALLYGNA